jgi:hypothetical protein
VPITKPGRAHKKTNIRTAQIYKNETLVRQNKNITAVGKQKYQ